MQKAELTIGPIFFHWPVEKKRDFYFGIADEAPVDTVYIGEVVCSKRTPFFEQHYQEVAERLRTAGKKVIFSTLAEVMIERDRKIVEGICALATEEENTMIEANDVSALWHLTGYPHAIGPFLNVYNEETVSFLAQNGTTHITLPSELPAEAIEALGKRAIASNVTLEVQVYGRLPLALSARCYHARAYGRVKDNCQFICEEDPDGMDLKTLVGKPFLTVNGIQTLSFTCLNLIREMEEIRKKGVSTFRLSPHSHDMVETARLFRAVLDYEFTPEEAIIRLEKIGLPVPFANGFYHKAEGHRWVEVDNAA